MNIQVITSWASENQGLIALIGLAIPAVSFVTKKLFFSEGSKGSIQKQKSGNGSVNTQAVGPVYNFVTINNSVDKITESVSRSLSGEVFPDANKIVKQNIQEYQENVKLGITKKGGALPYYAANIDDPDFRYIARMSVVKASRIESQDLRRVLAGLLVSRLGATAQLKKIAFNESIESVDRLTGDHLKIISLVFLLRYAAFTDIDSWKTLTVHLEKRIGKFIDFKNTKSQFLYLNSSRHGRTSVTHYDFFENFKKPYAFLFQVPVEKAKIEDFPTIKDKIMPILEVTKNEQGGTAYLFKVKNENELKDFLKKNDIKDNEGEGKRLSNLYNRYTCNSTKGLEYFIEKTGGMNGIGQKIVEVVKSSQIESVELTLIGIVTASTNIELVCGDEIDVDEWIEA